VLRLLPTCIVPCFLLVVVTFVVARCVCCVVTRGCALFAFVRSLLLFMRCVRFVRCVVLDLLPLFPVVDFVALPLLFVVPRLFVLALFSRCCCSLLWCVVRVDFVVCSLRFCCSFVSLLFLLLFLFCVVRCCFVVYLFSCCCCVYFRYSGLFGAVRWCSSFAFAFVALRFVAFVRFDYVPVCVR